MEIRYYEDYGDNQIAILMSDFSDNDVDKIKELRNKYYDISTLIFVGWNEDFTKDRFIIDEKKLTQFIKFLKENKISDDAIEELISFQNKLSKRKLLIKSFKFIFFIGALFSIYLSTLLPTKYNVLASLLLCLGLMISIYLIFNFTANNHLIDTIFGKINAIMHPVYIFKNGEFSRKNDD